jgi:DNA repair exonuclease SbcCD ATPase subunit
VIVFKNVRWKNLLSTGNSFIEIQLNKSSNTLIIGDNGAGKSTILDALCFGLFNKPFRPIKKDQLINSVNQGGTLVEIEFMIGNREYLVKRGIKKNLFEIYRDGKLLNQDAKIKDYQEFLEKNILKLNFKSFTQIVILGMSFIPFMQLRASDRRTIIEDLLDIEIFSVMNYLLRSKVTQNKDDIGTVDIALGLSENEQKLTKIMIDKLKEDKTVQIKKNKKDIEEHEEFLKTHKENINQIIKKIEELNESISDESNARGKIDSLHDYQRDIEKNIDKYENEIEFYEKNEACNICRQDIPKIFRKSMIENFHAKMHECGQALLKIGNVLQEKEKRISEIDTILSNVDLQKAEIAHNQNTIDACTQYIKKVAKQNEEISQMADDIDEKKKELNVIGVDIEIYNKEKEKLSNQKYLYELATTMLKDGGIKTRIIKQYLPIMNKLINKYLAEMDFFVSFNLDENFNESIKSRHRDEFTYDSFSEGEKMRIDLALLFTWRAVAKLKNSANTNLLILDEVFDSSLDAAGTDEFMRILNNLVKNTNVFVISHKGEILFDKFKSVLKFEKRKNFSQIIK